MKKIFALFFNLMIGTVLASFMGGGAVAAMGIGGALSLMPKMHDGLGMAIQKEIWMNSIIEGLFADNSFLSKAFSADEFVNAGKTVHIPNAGVASGVVKNRSSFPATVSQRTDVDLTFNLDNYSTNPIKIDLAETVELSYNKRESVLRQDRATLHNAISEGVLYEWFPLIANAIRTTGGAVAAHTPSATGNRKAFTKDDVKKAMTTFNKQDIPAEGRYMLVDADMYDQLIGSMTTQEAMAFHAQVDVANGVVGKLYGFNIMMRSRVGVYATAGTKKLWSTAGAATDNAAALAWHTNSICRALGEVVARESLNDPLYYGDIYAFEVRCGGRAMRNNVEGLLAIVQDASA